MLIEVGGCSAMVISQLMNNLENYPIKKRFPDLIKSLKILNQILNQLEHTNRRITHMMILSPKRISQVQVTAEMILIIITS